ncbi:MAG: flavin reductase family protein [Gemmatimonadota bacterium]
MNGDEVRASNSLDPSQLRGLDRYHLMTSLVVPRPIGWVSTRGKDGVPNLAPFSYFGAISAAPMLVGVSIGMPKGALKDTAANIRARDAFCVNVVTADLLEAMNETSATVPAEVDEFQLAGLTLAESDRVDAPFVAECPAVLECVVRSEPDLGDAANVFFIAEVVGIRLDPDLEREDGSQIITPESLRPVGRLGGAAYAVADVVRRVPRP